MTYEREYRIISTFNKMKDGASEDETREVDAPLCKTTKKMIMMRAGEIAKEFDQGIQNGQIAKYHIQIESVITLKDEWKGQIPMPNAEEDAFSWESIHSMNPSKQLVRGDVLKFRVTSPTHKKYGQWVYGICSGSGFGCNPSLTGNAIFVDWVGFDPLEVMSHNNDCDRSQYDRVERWERWFKLFVLADDKKEKVKK